MATAFHRNTLINQEGGVDREQFRVEADDRSSEHDRGRVAGAYRRLALNAIPTSSTRFPSRNTTVCSRSSIRRKMPTIAARPWTWLPARSWRPHGQAQPWPRTLNPAPPSPALSESELAQRQAEWEPTERAWLEAAVGAAAATWEPAKYVEYDTASGAGFQLLPDNSLLSDGRGAANDTYRVVARTNLPQVAAVRLRVLTHDSLPKNGPGRASNGNFVLTQFTASLAGAAQGLTRAVADHEQPGFPVRAAFDDDAKTGWAINVGPGAKAQLNADHQAVFVFAQPRAVGEQTLEFRLHHDLNQHYLIGRFALDVAATVPAGLVPPDDPLLAALRVAPEQRTEAQQTAVRQAFFRAHPQWADQDTAARPGSVALMVMQDVPQPRETYLLTRGDFTRPDKERGPLRARRAECRGTRAAWPATSRRTRLDLAQWLVHPQNPLTPRVTLNRLWLRYFGRGLVETEEDFGTQGTPPTHPELLDWLGREFIRRGWSLKAMHRLIVTSATYRQSSTAPAELADRDPRNLWLARQERLRLEAEIVRDAALQCCRPAGPHARRPQRPSAAAGRRVCLYPEHQGLEDRHRPGSLSAGHVHVLLPQCSVSAVDHVRRAGFPDRLYAPRRGRTRRCRP